MSTLGQRLVSPHQFDPEGPVPDLVNDAARRIASLRVKFVHQWMPGADGSLTTRELEELFDAAAIQAEWMRELYDALHPRRSVPACPGCNDPVHDEPGGAHGR